MMPPSVSPAISGKCTSIPDAGTAWLRTTSAKDKVAKLISRLSGIAAHGGKSIT
jgi:hypothetical protein